jgi:uncharacterized protein with GYD domain
MASYVILSRLSPEAFGEPADFKKLADRVSAKIRKDCPGITWKHSFVTLGRFDVVDVIEADDQREVERAIMIIRAYGHAETETMPAKTWKKFLEEL